MFYLGVFKDLRIWAEKIELFKKLESRVIFAAIHIFGKPRLRGCSSGWESAALKRPLSPVQIRASPSNEAFSFFFFLRLIFIHNYNLAIFERLVRDIVFLAVFCFFLYIL